MNGLLDDPNRAGLLAMGLGLLSSRGNFANALGQAGFQGLQAMQSTQDRLAQNRRNELQDTILRRQMEEADRKRMIEEARRNAMRGAFVAEKPATMDDRDVGQPGEMPVPQSFDMRRYATNLAQAGDAAALPLLEQLNQRRTQVLPTGQVVEFMPDGSVRELYKPAEKAPAPTREQLNFQAAQNNPAFMDFLRPAKPVAAAPTPRASGGPVASGGTPPPADGADPLARMNASDKTIVEGLLDGTIKPDDIPTRGGRRETLLVAARQIAAQRGGAIGGGASSGESQTERKQVAAQLGVPMPLRDPYAGLTRNASETMRRTLYNEADKELDKASNEVEAARRAIVDMNRFLQLQGQVSVQQGPVGGRLPALSSAAQEMDAIRDRITPTMREPGSGATSDFDARMFQSATIGRQKNEGANRAIANGVIAHSQNMIDRQQFMRDYLTAHGHIDGAQAAWRRYLQANPIFDPKSPNEPRPNANRMPYSDFFRNELQRSDGGGQQPANQQPAQGGRVVDFNSLR